MATKIQYSLYIGFLKSVKNTAITWGLPLIVVLVNNWQEWIPTAYTNTAAPIIGLLSYMIANYYKHK